MQRRDEGVQAGAGGLVAGALSLGSSAGRLMPRRYAQVSTLALANTRALYQRRADYWLRPVT